MITMNNINIKKVISAFISAFFTGFVFSIGVTTGIKPTEGGVAKFLLGYVCSTGEYIGKYDCTNLIIIMSCLTALGLLISIISHVAKSENWIAGIVSYGMGFFLGFMAFLLLF